MTCTALIAGPPAVFLPGPWLLLVVVLAGPFAPLFTFLIVLLVAASLVIALAAFVASPFTERTPHVPQDRSRSWRVR